MWKILAICVLLGEFIANSTCFQCKDENNNPIDWYVAYKLPRQKSHENEFIRDGLAFMYMTSKQQDRWTLSSVNINDTSSLIANTINALFNHKKEQNLHILYNDQPPYGPMEANKGHTKGVIMANGTAGFWLIHSVPHFPFSLDEYSYPKSGTHFGQSFLCISLNLKQLNNVGVQLQYNEPHIYAQNVPEHLAESMPDILKAANNETIKTGPWYHVENITSMDNVNFTSFAKSGKFHKDLYADLVSTVLEKNLYVETWPNEPNRLPSDCEHKYQVDNVLSISVDNPAISFATTVDHSKWAVSSDEGPSKWICIGDINRAKKQTRRGGGTACLNNEKVAEQYLNVVSSVQQCEKNNKK